MFICASERMTFCVSRSRRVSFNRKLNSFFCVHQSQSGAVKIVFFHASEIYEQCKSISSIKVGCIQRTVFFPESSENFLPKISRFHSLTVNFIWNSIYNHFYLRYVRIKWFFWISRSSRVWLAKKEQKSLHWSSGNIDTFINRICWFWEGDCFVVGDVLEH